MAYTPKVWANDLAGATPITAAELNRMELGLFLAGADMQHDIYKNVAAATVTATGGIAAPTLTATVANADDATGMWLQHTSGALLGNASGAVSAAFTQFQRGWDVAGVFSVRLGTDVTSQRVWVGFCSANPEASATPAVHLAAFRYDTGVQGGFWQCVTAAGTATQTVTTTSVAATASGAYRMRVHMTGSDVKFYIDGALVATHTTNLPTATQALGWAIRVTTLIAGARTVRWRRASFIYAG